MKMFKALISLLLTAKLASSAEIRVNWAPIVAGSATELSTVSAKIYDTIVMDYSGPCKRDECLLHISNYQLFRDFHSHHLVMFFSIFLLTSQQYRLHSSDVRSLLFLIRHNSRSKRQFSRCRCHLCHFTGASRANSLLCGSD